MVCHYLWLSRFSLKLNFTENVEYRTEPYLGILVTESAHTGTRDWAHLQTIITTSDIDLDFYSIIYICGGTVTTSSSTYSHVTMYNPDNNG